MSLRDAIREAVDERDKQGNQANDRYEDQPAAKLHAADLPIANLPTENEEANPKAQKEAQSNTTRAAQIKPSKEFTVNTANSKTVNTASNRSPQNPLKAKLEAKTERRETDPGKESGGGRGEGQETAALTVRVSRRHRIHWLISAKQQNTSLTAAITEALNARFGEPLSGESSQ